MSGRAVEVLGFGMAGIGDDLPAGMDPGDGAVVVLYLAPWEAYLARAADDDRAHDDWMVDWLAWHRELVALHDAAPGRVHLVNAGRLDSAARLAGHLDGAGMAWPDDIPLPRLGPSDLTVARILAGAMAEFARPMWEQYQALEARALLLGREPEFLGTAGLPDLARIDDLLQALEAVRVEARRSAQAGVARGTADAAGRNRQDAQLVAELRQENELLDLQLQQLHEELHFQVENGRQLRRLLAEAGDVATAARHLIAGFAAREAPPR